MIYFALLLSLILNIIQLVFWFKKNEERKDTEKARILRARVNAESDRHEHVRPS